MELILAELYRRYPALEICHSDIQAARDILVLAFRAGGKLLLCGNGGSAADAEHIAGELMKGFLLPRAIPQDECERLRDLGADDVGPFLQGALPAVALTGHPALASAVANDNRGDLVFAQQVYGLARAGDAVLGLSTSGNSANVRHALQVAKLRGAVTIALTGRAGGRLAELAEVCIRVPADNVVEIQELHLPVYHALCASLEFEFFAGPNSP